MPSPKPLLSLVVTVYNLEGCLADCLDSIARQAHPSLEVVLVDDGSSDGSPGICDDFSLATGSQVLHVANGGVSKARNLGFDATRGDFVWFFDGDDRLTPGAVDALLHRLSADRDVDLVHFGFRRWDGDVREEERPTAPVDARTAVQGKVIGRTEFLAAFLSSSRTWAAWANVFRRTTLEQEETRFREDLTCAEDCQFFFDAVVGSSKFLQLEEVLVDYRLGRPGSITSQASEKSIADQLTVFAGLAHKARQHSELAWYDSVFAERFCNAVTEIDRVHDRVSRTRLEKIATEHWNTLERARRPRFLVARYIWRVLGIERGNRLMRSLNGIRRVSTNRLKGH